MHAFTLKTAPMGKLFQKHSIWKKKFLKQPQMGKFARINSLRGCSSKTKQKTKQKITKT